MSRSLPTRLLHMLVALAMIHQLVVSLVMHVPRPGRAANLFWSAHETVGIASVGILFAFWLWALLRRRETPLGRLVPWLTREGRAALLDDLRRYADALRRFRLPHGEESPIASAVHGLGLLCATALAVTGLAFFLKGIAPALLVWALLQIHGTLGNVMWAYLIAHAGLAVLHELTGERILRRMSPLRAQ